MLAMMASQLAHVALRLAKVALRLPKVALKPPKVALKLAQVALPLADKARSSFRLAHRKPPRNHASVGSNVAGASIIGMSKNSAESGAVTVSLQTQSYQAQQFYLCKKPIQILQVQTTPEVQQDALENTPCYKSETENTSKLKSLGKFRGAKTR